MNLYLAAAILASAFSIVSCQQKDNQYFVWGKFSDLFTGKGNSRLTALEKKVSDIEKRQKGLFDVMCGVQYKGKCFRAVMHESTTTDRNEAIAMCQNMGWKLANVYDREHFNVLEKYLRNNLGTQSYRAVWLMMTWNRSTRQITMPDGSRPPTDLPWVNGYPSSSSSYTSIYLQINRSPDYRNNGLINNPYSSNRHGALCEIPVTF